MAKYSKTTSIRYLTQVKSAIDSFGATRITADDSTAALVINVGDTIVVTFSDKSQTDSADFSIQVNGSSTGSGQLKLYYGQVALEMFASDDFVWFKLGSNGSQYTISNLFVCEIKEGSDVYNSSLIYSGSNTFNTYTINDISFTKVGGESNLTVCKIFPYNAYPGTLDYSDTSVFANGGGRLAATTVFKSCSNVTYLSSLSFNGSNYMAIGTNNIIEIDPITL